MNKSIISIIIAIALSGCQTTSEMQKASTGGMANATSCAQIHAAFAAYDNDRQSLQVLAEATGNTSVNVQGVTPDTIDEYYESLRNNANLALMIKGCQPLPENRKP